MSIFREAVTIAHIYSYQINECYLSQKYQRESKLEFLVHRLMMPYLHSKYSPDAATDNCQHQQGCFRYTRVALLCLDLSLTHSLPFINAIDEESYDIDDYQIV